MATPVNGLPMKEGLIASSDTGELKANTGGNPDDAMRAISSPDFIVQCCAGDGMLEIVYG